MWWVGVAGVSGRGLCGPGGVHHEHEQPLLRLVQPPAYHRRRPLEGLCLHVRVRERVRVRAHVRAHVLCGLWSVVLRCGFVDVCSLGYLLNRCRTHLAVVVVVCGWGGRWVSVVLSHHIA